MSFNYETYLRDEHLPHIWCWGCGIGTLMKSIIKAIDKLNISKDSIAMVSGIGCVSRMPGYVDFNTLHVTHGRALSYATGIKLANPKLNVLVVAGDGDAASIGGNHLIHAARRNIRIVMIVYNNFIYGLTGGQLSPTSPTGTFTTTSPYGNIEPPFDLCKLAEGAGATFVARTTVYHTAQMEDYVRRAIEHKGFSFIDVLGHCHVNYGRRNNRADPFDNLEWFKKNTFPYEALKKLPPEKAGAAAKGKILTGIFKKEENEEYTERFWALIDKVRKAN